MEDYLKHALEIVKAQASVRVMEEEAIISMVKAVAASLKQLEEEPDSVAEERMPVMEAAKSIKEKSVTCLECGKSFKIITKKHLATHGLDAAGYREKWGFKKNTPLVCKDLQRERRKKMKDMQLWEKRRIAHDAKEK